MILKVTDERFCAHWEQWMKDNPDLDKVEDYYNWVISQGIQLDTWKGGIKLIGKPKILSAFILKWM